MNRNAKSVPKVAWEYWGIIETMQKNPGLYHMDDMREKCHVRLCGHYKITKDQSRSVTDNLDRYGDAVEMHDALKKLSA